MGTQVARRKDITYLRYCVTGRLIKPRIPSISKIIDTTVDRTGLSMNFFSMKRSYLNTACNSFATLSNGTGCGWIGVL